MLPTYEIAVLLVLLVVSWLRPWPARWQVRIRRGFGRLASQKRLALALVGLVTLGGCVLTALFAGWPQPQYTDEYSYLLAADTFAHGRLANPTHPLWAHFESFHVIQEPTYASKYPPAQGLVLAAGQLLCGRPIVGVWLSLALAVVAIGWMLQAWLPPRWALLGALLASARLVFWGHPFGPEDLAPGYWSQSYFGGAVAAAGGALLFGSLRRLVQRPHWSLALTLGFGLAILANSRPFEGFLACLPVGACLLGWSFGKDRPRPAVLLGQVALPLGSVVALTVAGLGYYNGRVTGDPLRMPYQIHEATYAVTPLFLWQPLKPEPSYRHAAIAENQLGWSREEYLRQQSLSGWAERAAQKCGKLLLFYLGIGLLVPLVALRLVLRDRWMLFAALACAWQLAAMLQATWVLPHYAAPVTGLLYALAVGALRSARLWRSGERRPGRAIVPALVLGYAVLIVLGFVVERRPGPDDFPVQRTALLARLEQSNGRHLVLVRYQPKPLGRGHDEWVYNGADIDRQKVVWARAMGPEEDRRLIEYFQDRQIWLLEADQKPPRLTPYGETEGGRSMATMTIP